MNGSFQPMGTKLMSREYRIKRVKGTFGDYWVLHKRKALLGIFPYWSQFDTANSLSAAKLYMRQEIFRESHVDDAPDKLYYDHMGTPEL